MNEHPAKAFEVLLVEDSLADQMFATEALKEAKARNRVSIVQDGVEAVAFLRRQGKYCDAPRPQLILLDLNLPRKNGREVLAEIKADPLLRDIPVVILTTSAAEEDIARCYSLHANCFVTKPMDFEDFKARVLAIEHFWFSVVQLPPKEHFKKFVE
jgi:two-component system, chemotaxis family, response regulator Rcp1